MIEIFYSVRSISLLIDRRGVVPLLGIAEIRIFEPIIEQKPTLSHPILFFVTIAIYRPFLKVPKCEIFDRSDFHDFYPMKSLWEGDFGVKIKCFKQNIQWLIWGRKIPYAYAQSNFKEGFCLSLDKINFFGGKLLRPYVGVYSDFLKFSLFQVL